MMVSSACQERRRGGRSCRRRTTAGTMMQMQRGGASAPTNSSSEPEPVLPSPASPATASGLTSKTTQSWPRASVGAPCWRPCAQSDHPNLHGAAPYPVVCGATLAPGSQCEGSSATTRLEKALRAVVGSARSTAPWRPSCVHVIWLRRSSWCSRAARRRPGIGRVALGRRHLQAAPAHRGVAVRRVRRDPEHLPGDGRPFGMAALRLLHLGRDLARGHRRRPAGRGHEAACRTDLRLRQERRRLHGHCGCDLQLPGHAFGFLIKDAGAVTQDAVGAPGTGCAEGPGLTFPTTGRTSPSPVRRPARAAGQRRQRRRLRRAVGRRQRQRLRPAVRAAADPARHRRHPGLGRDVAAQRPARPDHRRRHRGRQPAGGLELRQPRRPPGRDLRRDADLRPGHEPGHLGGDLRRRAVGRRPLGQPHRPDRDRRGEGHRALQPHRDRRDRAHARVQRASRPRQPAGARHHRSRPGGGADGGHQRQPALLRDARGDARASRGRHGRLGGTNKFGELFLRPGTTRERVFRVASLPVGPADLIKAAQDAGSRDVDPTNPSRNPDSRTRVNGDLFDSVTDLVGPMGFTFLEYQITPQPGEAPHVHRGPTRYPPFVPRQPRHTLRVANFNMENLFAAGMTDDGHTFTRRRGRRQDDAPRGRRRQRPAPPRRRRHRGGGRPRAAAGGGAQAARLHGLLAGVDRRAPHRGRPAGQARRRFSNLRQIGSRRDDDRCRAAPTTGSRTSSSSARRSRSTCARTA